MPRTVDHIVTMRQLAAERRRAGKPVWNQTINLSGVFHSDDLSFQERRDAVVRILRASRWLAGKNAFDDLVSAVDGLATAEDAEQFDDWLDEIYDHADYDRVWIDTH